MPAMRFSILAASPAAQGGAPDPNTLEGSIDNGHGSIVGSGARKTAADNGGRDRQNTPTLLQRRDGASTTLGP